MIPARFAPILFGLILSGLMSLIVSGQSTFRALRLVDGFFGLSLSSLAFAFPTVLVVAPITLRIVGRLTR